LLLPKKPKTDSFFFLAALGIKAAIKGIKGLAAAGAKKLALGGLKAGVKKVAGVIKGKVGSLFKGGIKKIAGKLKGKVVKGIKNLGKNLKNRVTDGIKNLKNLKNVGQHLKSLKGEVVKTIKTKFKDLPQRLQQLYKKLPKRLRDEVQKKFQGEVESAKKKIMNGGGAVSQGSYQKLLAPRNPPRFFRGVSRQSGHSGWSQHLPEVHIEEPLGTDEEEIEVEDMDSEDSDDVMDGDEDLNNFDEFDLDLEDFE